MSFTFLSPEMFSQSKKRKRRSLDSAEPQPKRRRSSKLNNSGREVADKEKKIKKFSFKFSPKQNKGSTKHKKLAVVHNKIKKFKNKPQISKKRRNK